MMKDHTSKIEEILNDINSLLRQEYECSNEIIGKLEAQFVRMGNPIRNYGIDTSQIEKLYDDIAKGFREERFGSRQHWHDNLDYELLKNTIHNTIDKTISLSIPQKKCCVKSNKHTPNYVLYEDIYNTLDCIIPSEVNKQKILKVLKEYIKKSLVEIYKKQFISLKNYKGKIQNLYRFMPIDYVYTIEHLRDKTLFMSNPAIHFNDPYDCIAFRQNDLRTIPYGDEDTPRLWKQPVPILESLIDDDKLRVRCFNQGSMDNIPKEWTLMMSHYATNHKGIIVEYEFEVTKITNENVKFLKVNYTDIIGLDIKAGLSNKAKCWKYEQEYRFAYWLNDKNSSPKIPLKELGLTISKIIFLCNTSQADKDNIINSLDIDFNAMPQDNKIALKSGKPIEIKQVVMKRGYNSKFEIVDQDIDFDTQRLKAS